MSKKLVEQMANVLVRRELAQLRKKLVNLEAANARMQEACREANNKWIDAVQREKHTNASLVEQSHRMLKMHAWVSYYNYLRDKGVYLLDGEVQMLQGEALDRVCNEKRDPYVDVLMRMQGVAQATQTTSWFANKTFTTTPVPMSHALQQALDAPIKP